MALKDWKKIQMKKSLINNITNFGQGVVFINIKTGKHLAILESQINNDFSVTIEKSSIFEQTFKNFKIKNEAIKYAKHYMKNN